MILRSSIGSFDQTCSVWVYIPMQCVENRQMHTDRKREFLRAFCPKTHTHTREFAKYICEHCACNRNLSFALIQWC
uniref:Uncharacterized protein n=1 Tax=Helianthus annuus TaxID=4232 RepID=A0A251RT09_HELAN